MQQTVEAVFEGGMFRPVVPQLLSLSEGQRVRLTVETEESRGDALGLATGVYAGLSKKEIDEVERIALNRQTFFGRPVAP